MGGGGGVYSLQSISHGSYVVGENWTMKSPDIPVFRCRLSALMNPDSKQNNLNETKHAVLYWPRSKSGVTSFDIAYAQTSDDGCIALLLASAKNWFHRSCLD